MRDELRKRHHSQSATQPNVLGHQLISRKRESLLAGTILSWANYAIAVLAAVLLTPTIIRRLGVPAYGIWVFISQLGNYAAILDLGVHQAVVRRVAQARATGDDRGTRSALSSAIILHLGFASVIAVAFAALAALLPRWFDLKGVEPDPARAAVFVYGLGTALGLPANLVTAGLKGCLRFDLVGGIGVLVQVVRNALVVASIWLGMGIAGLAGSNVVANLVGWVSGAGLLARELGGAFFSGRVANRSEMRALLGFGIYNLFGTAGYFLAYTSDAVVIGVLLTPRDIAHFGVAANVIAILGGLVGSYAGFFLPIAAQQQATGPTEGLGGVYLAGIRTSLAIALPFVIAFVGFGPDLLAAWVGNEVGIPAGRLLRILALAHLPVLANGVGFQVALGIGLHRLTARLCLLEGLINVALSCVLATRYGVSGVAIGTLVPSLIFRGFAWPFCMGTKLGIAPLAYWSGAIRPAVLPAVPVLVVGTAARRFADPLSSGALFGLVVAGIVAYWFCAWFTCFSPEQRREFLVRFGRRGR